MRESAALESAGLSQTRSQYQDLIIWGHVRKYEVVMIRKYEDITAWKYKDKIIWECEGLRI